MIYKLESAGLGFYVKANQTQQKLGKVPLRQLVYRVLDLPASMKPLVYDFGQLTSMTETEYTGQIVHNYCKDSLDATVVKQLSHVLAWCQDFMRKKNGRHIAQNRKSPLCELFKYFFEILG